MTSVNHTVLLRNISVLFRGGCQSGFLVYNCNNTPGQRRAADCARRMQPSRGRVILKDLRNAFASAYQEELGGPVSSFKVRMLSSKPPQCQREAPLEPSSSRGDNFNFKQQLLVLA